MHLIVSHEIFSRGLALPDDSVHNIKHWERVEQLGHLIAADNGADKEVISLFAYLHDARRVDDFTDIEHGLRAVFLLDELIAAEIISLTERQYQQLSEALRLHSYPEARSADPTIQACWDADRLDLWRAGIEPLPEFLFTARAKSPAMIALARELNGF